jgi:hypothetical protein
MMHKVILMDCKICKESQAEDEDVDHRKINHDISMQKIP